MITLLKKWTFFFFTIEGISTCLYADVNNLIKGESFMLKRCITTGAIPLSRKENMDLVTMVPGEQQWQQRPLWQEVDSTQEQKCGWVGE